MNVIGITGGAGAGKSEILDYIDANYRAKVLKADEIAHNLMEPGSRCYEALQGILPKNVFEEDGKLNREALSDLLFSQEELRNQINSIVHPAVKVYIIDTIAKEREMGAIDYLIVEAALLIEAGYGEICDELWYIYTSPEIRRKRLMEIRGYSEKKVDNIFRSQLSDGEYRKQCKIIIDNNKEKEYAFLQVMQALSEKGELAMDVQELGEKLVFGLDIGTRNVVGTVGYKEEDEFYVVAQYVKEHATRSMLDGQIHDIGRVGRTIEFVKRQLEQQIGINLHEVCIAAAGRVLKTVTTSVEYEFDEETVVEREHIHTLDLLGVEKAQQILRENNDTKFKFYSVGYSVVKYYLNEDVFSNLENHKAEKIGEDIIVTFLPEDVVDGLYSAVALAGLTVSNLTLEPIAAINVAIPETFRMLNIALVDVGAGTSDISITKEGSIIAYGMIPCAGDELTELIVQHYLVDFKTAEHIKLTSGIADEIEYTDIMSISHTIPSEEVWELMKPLTDKLTTDIAEKIKELNGGQTVSATFVVGGGGKVHKFVENLSEELELPKERVALRGEEVLREVHFKQEGIEKDPLLVTPIGICLNYYDQRNNFIFVRFNGERIKLYDNGKLTIVDAAMEAGFPNEQLFPRRGKEINYTLDGKSRIARGGAGESAIVKVNGTIVNINTPLESNSDITIEPSTAGENASLRLEEMEDYNGATLSFEVNGRMISCPRFFEVNGSLESPAYQIQEGDRIETRSFYTVGQVMEFMDVEVDQDQEILVNNRPGDMDTLVYENFSIDCRILSYLTPASDVEVKRRPADRNRDRENGSGWKGAPGGGQNTGSNSGSGQTTDGRTASGEPGTDSKAASGSGKSTDGGSQPGTDSKTASGGGNASDKNGKNPDGDKKENGKEAGPALEWPFGQVIAQKRKEEAEARKRAKEARESQGTNEGDSAKELSKERTKETVRGQLKDALNGQKPALLKDGKELDGTNSGSGNKAGASGQGGAKEASGKSITVTANREQVTLTGQECYILVDIFNYLSFDLNAGGGRRIVVKLNGDTPSYMQELKDGDVVEVYWQD